MKKKIWLGILGFLLLFVAFLLWLKAGGCGIDKSKISMQKPQETATYYEIHHVWMAVPLDRIVLMRKGQDVGAFKFTYYEEKAAEYEWYYPLQYGLDKTKSGKSIVRDILFPIMGRLVFQLGNTKIKCGPLKINWFGPNCVNFYGSEEEYLNASVELAPTNKEMIEEINLNDPKLKWYKCTEQDRKIKLPLDEL